MSNSGDNKPAKPKTITIALTGNPNSGKTTIFNNLTGAHQRVGNYGGVTVETKEGILHHEDYTIRVVDLPGTYSLTAYSIEEIVSRNFILYDKPDVVVNIVDGSNLERNLYLAAQLMELDVPMVLGINMADEMDKQGLSLDRKALRTMMGAPVVLTVGTKNRGTRKLVEKIIEVATGQWRRDHQPRIHYGEEIETELTKIAEPIIAHVEADEKAGPSSVPHTPNPTSPRWTVLKLLENDAEALQTIHDPPTRKMVLEQVSHSKARLNSLYGEDPEMIIAEQRYGHVRGICRAVIRHSAQARMNVSDKIDKVLTNRLLGLPIFALLMYITFWLVFTVGEHPMTWMEGGFEWLAERIAAVWPIDNWTMMRSLVLDGIIGGVGGVVVFLPNIMLLFLALALLEDTGYMARAAFIMDRLMKWVGLHGKSFIPMLSGFGCTVPGIMGTRILDNQRDRLTTILVLPLMSCGARLPIYMLIIPAFFGPSQAGVVMYSIYIIGIVLAVIGAKLLRSTLFKGESSPFVMELPPYRIPTLRAVMLHMWHRSWLYLRKAGTVILAISIVMWALTAFPRLPQDKLQRLQERKAAMAITNTTALAETSESASLSDEEIREAELTYSLAGRLGKTIEPAMKPLGFDWKISTALIGAMAAKELFVSQMGIVYSLGDVETENTLTEAQTKLSQKNQDNPAAQSITETTKAKQQTGSAQALRTQLRRHYSPLAGFCIMLFCLIASPCIATVAVTRRETSWRWALLQWGGLTAIAYVLTLVVYQLGSLLQIGTSGPTG